MEFDVVELHGSSGATDFWKLLATQQHGTVAVSFTAGSETKTGQFVVTKLAETGQCFTVSFSGVIK